MRRILILAALAAIFAAPAFTQSNEWTIDPSHAVAQFTVRHLMISNVKGEFSKVTGAMLLDEKDITKSGVQVSIDTATVDTREEKRDAHLRSADFFDVAKYPTMTFQSKRVVAAPGSKLKVIGDLTIRGVTREVTLDAELTPAIKDPWGNWRRGVSASTTINRKDFGLTWNAALEAGGVAVGDEVKINIDLELLKKQ